MRKRPINFRATLRVGSTKYQRRRIRGLFFTCRRPGAGTDRHRTSTDCFYAPFLLRHPYRSWDACWSVGALALPQPVAVFARSSIQVCSWLIPFCSSSQEPKPNKVSPRFAAGCQSSCASVKGRSADKAAKHSVRRCRPAMRRKFDKSKISQEGSRADRDEA